MILATFVSIDPKVRGAIERNADALAQQAGVDFVSACDEDEFWPAWPYVARANDDMLLVLEFVLGLRSDVGA